MKPFVSAEKLFPNWKAARTVILSLVPAQYVVVAIQGGTLRLDLSWIDALLKTVPREDFTMMFRCFDMANEYHQQVAIENGMVELLTEEFLGAQIDRQLLQRVTKTLSEYDARLVAKGKPSLRQSYLHFLGVKEFQETTNG